MNIIKHNLPIYYNPQYNGLMVVHSKNNKTAMVGGCCHHLNDAYTNICRYEIPIKKLREWKRLNKRKINQYSFIEKYELAKSLNVLRVKDISLTKEIISNDYLRCMWDKDSCIISRNYR